MKWIFAFLTLVFSQPVAAQLQVLDSLQREYRLADTEEEKIDILNLLSFQYNKVSLDKSEETALEALDRANVIRYQKGIATAYSSLGIRNAIGGRYDEALDFFIKSLKLNEKLGDAEGAARSSNNLAGIFMYQKNYAKALEYSSRALAGARKQGNNLSIGNALEAHALIYEHMEDTASAMNYFRQALATFREAGNRKKQGEVKVAVGSMLLNHNMLQPALDVYFEAMNLIDIRSDYIEADELYMALGQIYAGLGNERTATHYFLEAIALADKHGARQEQIASRLKFSEFHANHRRYDSALYYHREYAAMNEETFSKEIASRQALLEKVYETEKKDQLLQSAQAKVESQYLIIVAISIALGLLAVTGFVLFRFYREKKRSNEALSSLNRMIHERNEEITAQSEELMEANEEIRRINESLEEEVTFRTAKIKEQHEKLIDYAYFNSHKVRGPLARILGLAMLIRKTPIDPDEASSLNEMIFDSAMEMDEIIKEINKKLESD